MHARDDYFDMQRDLIDAAKAAATKLQQDNVTKAFYAMTPQQHIDHEAAIKAIYNHIPCTKCQKNRPFSRETKLYMRMPQTTNLFNMQIYGQIDGQSRV